MRLTGRFALPKQIAHAIVIRQIDYDSRSRL